MTKILTWYKRFSVNNEEIDKQHKALFDIFNRLYDRCVESDDNIDLKSLILELVSYTDYHFLAEEQYMRDTGYKDIDRHISEHRIFTETILQLQCDGYIKNYGQAKELLIFLRNWILNHIMEEDKKIAG